MLNIHSTYVNKKNICSAYVQHMLNICLHIIKQIFLISNHNNAVFAKNLKKYEHMFSICSVYGQYNLEFR